MQVILTAGTVAERQHTHILSPLDKEMSHNMVVQAGESVTLYRIMHN